MQGLMLVVVVAIVTEVLADYVGSIWRQLTAKEWKTASAWLMTTALAVVLCFAADADLFSALDIRLKWPPLGIVLTGIFSSRGVVYVTGFIRRLQNRRPEPTDNKPVTH